MNAPDAAPIPTVSDAVQFMLNNEVESEALLMEVMKTHPNIFLMVAMKSGLDVDLMAANLVRLDPGATIKSAATAVSKLKQIQKIKDSIELDNLVSAIKLLREDTGYGLKDAKDVVMAVSDQLTARGLKPPRAGATGSPLVPDPNMPAECKALVNSIMMTY